MSGRARITVFSAAATLMTATALLPLVSPVVWVFQATLLLTVQSAVGAATRRVPLARPLTVAVQALTALALLTLSFAHRQALFGVVPGPDAFRHFADLFQQGTTDVGRYSIPAPASDGIRLMLVGGVLVIGLAVDTLAVTFRNAAPAGLPLLALYSVAAGLSDGPSDWLWFLLAAVGYLMLLLAEGRDRLTRWGRVFGGSSRGSARSAEAGGPLAPARAGRRIGVVTLGLALIVPLALPAAQGGLLGGLGKGTGSGTGGDGTATGVNLLVSLRDSLNSVDDRQVLSERTDGTSSGTYLRIVSLDDFDGITWKPSDRRHEALPDSLPDPTGLGQDVRRTEVTTRIAAADWYAQSWLPMPYPPSGVRVEGDWRYEPVDMAVVGDHGQDTHGLTYEVSSLEVQPTAQQLAAAPAPPDDLEREYTALPKSLPSVVAKTAREVTAGSASHYQEAVALQNYFTQTGGFTYDTTVQVGSGFEAIARFLRDKRGFCVHFSFAMAAMARSLGIPARVAVGFAPGTQQADGSVSVGLKDAHAWPELYFQGVGWTRFEPTPTRGSVPAYTLPDSSGNSVPDPALPSRSTSAGPSTAPSASESCSAVDRKNGGCASESPEAAVTPGGGGPGTSDVLAWTLGGLAAIGLVLSPLLWRVRRRAVRLGGARGHALPAGAREHAEGTDPRTGAPPGARGGPAVRHTLAVWDELTCTAWDFGILPDDSLTPRGAAARIVRRGGLTGEPAASVHRVANAVEQVLYAPHPYPAAGLAADARLVTAALRASANRRARLRATFAPRSAVRVLWAASARWTETKTRLSTAKTRIHPRRGTGHPRGQEG
ncbi:transglutaminaseTgpA domain-containing protein [Streptomyces sp. NPDC008150]|uniref:transglutaminase TgpA family protein n=1 Tax=Streptomyces sp. NPDC008150 TaxID=3364816 RepID=UPI0036EFBA2D